MFLSIIGKKNEAGYLLQNRAERYNLSWGNIKKRTTAFRSVDAVWVPHYNISLSSIALNEDFREVTAPILLSIHDIHPAIYPEDHSADDITRFNLGFIPFARRCQRIITHSQYQKLAIIEHFQLNTVDISVTPQPPLIDPTIFLDHQLFNRPLESEIRFGITRPYVFYPASTTHSHKNHLRLLSVWLNLKQKLGNDCPMLVCTGKGNNQQWKYLSAIINAYSLNKDVIFTGMVDIQTLVELYKGSILIVLPTTYEGAGSGIFTDALVAGKPVICSDIPQIREQITALGSVIVDFFDPFSIPSITNAVSTALKKIDALQKIAENNQKLVKSIFKKMWVTWAEFYAQEIENLIKYNNPFYFS
jgi:glycosyltransferase involved in cell wall biosynthesis